MTNTLLALDLSKEYKLNATTNVADVFKSPADFFNKLILPNMYIFAGIIFLFLLIGGGVAIVMSSGDSKGTEKGMQTVKTAIAGLLIIFASYWIIQIVQLAIGVPILGGK
jgi:hypothetical protein